MMRVLLAVCFLWVLPGCERGGGGGSGQGGGSGSGNQVQPLRVVATTAHGLDAFLVVTNRSTVFIDRSGNGRTIESRALMGPTTDPHTYKLTRDDAAALNGADIIITMGLHLEGKMDEVLTDLTKSTQPNRPKLIVLSSFVKQSDLIHVEEDGKSGAVDPHFWMDPMLWTQAVRGLAGAIGELSPEHAGLYVQNAERYDREELVPFYERAKQAAGTIPANQRILVTSHDAFAYFARWMGLRVVSPQGISTEDEASVRAIEQIVGLIKEHQLPAIFPEASVAPKTIEAIAQGVARTSGNGRTVSTAHTLYSDTLGPSGSATGTYLGMLDHNTTTIVRGLGGQAPDNGLTGKLEAKK